MSPLSGGRLHCVIPQGMWVPVAVWQCYIANCYTRILYFTTLLSLSDFNVFSGNINAFFYSFGSLFFTSWKQSFLSWLSDYSSTAIYCDSSFQCICYFVAYLCIWYVDIFPLTYLLRDGNILPPEHFPPNKSRSTYITGLCWWEAPCQTSLAAWAPYNTLTFCQIIMNCKWRIQYIFSACTINSAKHVA